MGTVLPKYWPPGNELRLNLNKSATVKSALTSWKRNRNACCGRLAVWERICQQKRQRYALKLSTAVEKQLNDLQLDGARFEVQFTRDLAVDGAYVGDARYAFDGTGLDQAEFVISTNPGEPLKPVAQGGQRW